MYLVSTLDKGWFWYLPKGNEISGLLLALAMLGGGSGGFPG
jgi:hypothetical protein